MQNHINYLRETVGVDYVILLAHLGIGGDALEENTSAGLLKKVHGVDALIDGHSHLVYSQNTPDINGKLVFMKANINNELDNINQLFNDLGCNLENIIRFKLPIEESNRSLVIITKNSMTKKQYPRRIDIIKKTL